MPTHVKKMKSGLELVLRPNDYVCVRDYVIGEIVNNSRSEYADSRKDLSEIIELTVELQIADPDWDFIKGLLGFIFWCQQTGQKRSSVLSTLIHDLVEFKLHRTKDWFSPRTTRYIKYAS